MVTTLLLMAMVFAVGTRAADSLRVRQEEVILRKLTIPQAADYYELLRKRARRVRLLRAITFAALVLAILAGRRRFLAPRLMGQAGQSHSEATPAGPPTNTDAAKAIAAQELARQGARGQIDAANLQLQEVSGDERHPWIFDYAPRGGSRDAARVERVRIYVDRAGKAELHRIP